MRCSGGVGSSATATRSIGIGILVSFALQRLAASLQFGVDAADRASGVAVIVLAIVALVACYLPALRATRVSPLRALRYE